MSSPSTASRTLRPSDPRLRSHLLAVRKPLVVGGVASVIGVLLLIAQAIIVGGLVVAAIGHHAPLSTNTWAVLILVLLVVRGLLSFVGDLAQTDAAGGIGRRLRGRVVEAIIRRPSSSSETESTGGRALLATRGVSAIEPYVTRYVPAYLLALVLPVLALIAIACFDWLAALIVLLTLPLIPVFGVLVGLATRDRASAEWQALSSLAAHFLDVVRGLPTLVLFRRGEAQVETIRTITHRYRRRTLETLKIAFASSAVLELVATISVAIVAVTMGLRLAYGHIGLERALVVLLLAPEAYWPLRRLGAEFHAASEGGATIDAVADLEAELDDSTGRSSGAASGETRGAVRELVVSDVSLTFSGRTAPALSPVSATFGGRGVTAITGPSGSGKSTLLSILAGLVEPTTGELNVNRGDGWRSQVAYVPQSPQFIAGTVAENLRLAAPMASDAELWAALAEVSLDERVHGLGDGLATYLGEDGAGLSAGERARLAFARVILSNRPWVMLDEPTAHIDVVTEQILARTITRLGRSRGVVLVAHKPALVRLADRTVALGGAGASRGASSGAKAAPAAPTSRLVELAPEEPSVETSGVSTDEPVALLDEPQRGPRSLALAYLLGGLATASGVALTATAGWLIVRASQHPGVLLLTVAMVGVRFFGLARPGFRYVERLLSHDVVLARLADRRAALYALLVPLTPGRLGRRPGELLASVVDDVDALADRDLRARLPLVSFAVATLLALGGAAVVAPGEAAVTLPLILVTALGGGVAFVVARAAARRAEPRMAEARGELSTRVTEIVRTGSEYVMWQGWARPLAAVDDSGRRLAAATRASVTGAAAGRLAAFALCGVSLLGLALALTGDVTGGTLSAPKFAFLLLIPLALSEAATGLVEAGTAAARADAAEARLDEIAALEPAVTESRLALPLPDETDVIVDRVTATWVKDAIPAIDEVGMTLAEGERVALVGPSGSGKSTVAALLLRFLDPTKGLISLGGTDYRDLALDDLRSRVGFVDDAPYLFASTLVENVRLARPGATDDEVAAALRAAQLGDWLEQLPEGLGTFIGDGHDAVSGGERARIGIARCLLADQPVLVLDEPVAHLDTATANRIALEILGSGKSRPPRASDPSAGTSGTDDPLPKGRTILWISHATAGLTLADRTLVLERRDGVSHVNRLEESS